MPLAGASGEKNSDRSGLPNHIKFFHKSLTEVTFFGLGVPGGSIEAWNTQTMHGRTGARLSDRA